MPLSQDRDDWSTSQRSLPAQTTSPPPPPSPITSERCRAPILHGNTTAPHKKMPSYKLPTERSPPVRHMFATLAFGEPGAVLE
jgi:hypothetical protein